MNRPEKQWLSGFGSFWDQSSEEDLLLCGLLDGALQEWG